MTCRKMAPFGQVAVIFLDLSFASHKMVIMMLKLPCIYKINEYKIHPRRTQLFFIYNSLYHTL